jgi:glycosyltransferase involved in cell wall biosynthesis
MKKGENERIKVCIFSLFGYSLYNPKSDIAFGGAEVQLYLISKELAKNKNIKLSVILAGENPHFNRVEKLSNIDIYVSIPAKSSKKNYLKGFLFLILTLIKINPDVVIKRMGGAISFLLALYCKIFRKKFIFSIAHEDDVSKKGFSKLIQPLHDFVLNSANLTIAQNKEQIQTLVDWKNKIKNVKLIKSGYKISNVEFKNKSYILWVGRSIKWKHPEIFLKLAKKFPNEMFVMICQSFNKKLFSWIKVQAKKINNVRFFEFVPFQKINRYFSEAKIFINTSSKEGFPNTFIQAAKNSTPIISLNVNPDNFIKRYECGFFCNGNMLKLEKYLRNLLNDKEKFQKFSKNCFRYVNENHSIEKIIKEWETAIFNLVNYFH